MTPRIFDHFTKTVNDYDTVADKVVMKNDELHSVLINAIDLAKNKRIEVLDLGSGTGHGMKLILKKYSRASVTGIDFSSKMINKSKRKLKKYLSRIEFLEEDFDKIIFPKKYDVIVSAVTIHNSSHDNKKRLFKKIFTSLKKGGLFINGDFIKAENNLIDKHYRTIYRNYIEKNLSGEELKVWLKHAFVDDQPMRLSDQFIHLKRAGFTDIQLLWQYNNEAVYRARKK
jgi:tRNA (cmo5U34)-methyltransferase